MNYSAIYNQLIEKARTSSVDGYGEWHHIQPRCLGGTDEESNLVFLSAKAHYVAHHLLCKMHPNNRKILHAFVMMTVSSNRHDRKITASMFEAAKKARSKAFKGRRHTEETKAKMRKPKSESHRQKLKEHLDTVRPTEWSDERKDKHSKAMKGNKWNLGRKHTAEARAKMSAAQKGRAGTTTGMTWKVNHAERVCPHCGKTGKGPNMSRYHFDNCKAIIK